MRLLTRQETGVLKGELNRLNLPKKTSLYICPGLPQVFRHVVSDNKDHFENSWLYIPLDMLRNLRQSLIVNSINPDKNYISPDPIEIDEFNFYPILVDGEISGFLSIEDNHELHLTKKTTRHLIDGMSFFIANQKENNHSTLLEDVINRLFKSDVPFEQYVKQMLKMFNKQYPKSCVAIYYDEGERTSLRMVVGDLLHVDSLPGEVDQETVDRWNNAIEKQIYFLPDESLPSHPSLQNVPPDFMFVHPSIKSQKADYTIVQRISGDIEYPCVENIKRLAELTSQIETSKFISTKDIVSLYDDLIINNRLKYTMDELLKEIFKKINSYIGLSRLVLYQPGKLSRVICCDEKTPKIIISGQNVVTGDLNKILKNKAIAIRGQILTEDVDVKLKETYKEFNINSECYCAIGAPDNSTYYLVFSCEEKTDKTLNDLKDFINHARLLIQNYINLVFTMQRDDKTKEGIAITNQKILTQRQDTITQLSEGYYHDVYGMISVILGQSELLKEKVAVCNENELPDIVNSSVLKVERAADDIISYLDIIKKLGSRSSDDLKKYLSVKDVLTSLPLLMHGYSKQLVDTRGIFLKIAFRNINSFDFKIAQHEVYDYLMPLIMTLYKSADKSGVFTLKYATQYKANFIKIEYESELMEQKRLLMNLKTAFDCFDIVKNDDGTIVMPLPFARLVLRDESSDISAVYYEKEMMNPNKNKNQEIANYRN